MIGDYSGDHSFAIKYTTDVPHCIRRACHLSGLSGCNFGEAEFWGKVKREALNVKVFSEANNRSSYGSAGAEGIENEKK